MNDEACSHQRVAYIADGWSCETCAAPFTLVSPAPDFSSITLGQLDALAARVGSAARTLQEARALLGGGAPAPVAPLPVAAPVAPAVPRPVFDAEHLARKEALLQMNKPSIDDLPEDMKALERS